MSKQHNLYNILLLVTVSLLLSNCEDSSSASRSTLNIGAEADPAIVASLPFQTRSFQMGTAGYVPDNYPDSSDADWQAFFDRGAAQYGGLFGVHVAHDTDKDSEDILVQVRMAYEDVKLVIPYVELAFSHEKGIFTDSIGKELVKVARANAQRYKPVYMSIGVEINSYYLHEPETGSYDLYVQYAREALDAIKEVSPNTIRMTNFQLDFMKGDQQLTGETYMPHWELLDDFQGKIDAISFTVYPFLHYTKVDDIPDNYLNEIRQHTNLPILISETGWPDINLSTGVEGSTQTQIDYMLKISGQANQVNAQTLIWVLPRDAEFGVGGGIFDNISLYRNDGQAKAAYEYWKAIHALPETD